ncbi:MAG: hypothetical protein EPN25_12165 [Nitrospirae bacterium]|nr:MAG: hypothetical protein EPN25_12165 [Nitrospirota bacterium]
MKQLKDLFRGIAIVCLLFIVAAAGTAFAETSYSASGVLYLSQVNVSGEGMFEVFLKTADKNGQEFFLQSATPFVSGQPADATFDQATGVLHISDLAIVVGGSRRDHVSVDMTLVPGSDPMRFRVTSVIEQNLPYSGGNVISGIIGPEGNIVGGSGGFSVTPVDFGFLYAVDFGTDASGFVCSCTQSFELRAGPPARLSLAAPFGLASCIIMKGGLLRKNSLDLIIGPGGPNTIMFEFPDGTSGFHFICVKS